MKGLTGGASAAPATWLGLTSIYLVMASQGYVYSSLEPLARLLKNALRLTETQFGLLGGAYFIPNMILAIAGGLVVDRLGPRRSMLLFACIASVGAILMASSDSFRIILIARCIVGLGGEPLTIASLIALARRCEGTGAGLAIGFGVAASRIGALAVVTSPSWASSLYAGREWRPPAYLAAGVGLLMLLGAWLHSIAVSSIDVHPPSANLRQRFLWRRLQELNRPFWYLAGVCASFYAVVGPFRTFAIMYFQDTSGLKLPDAARISGVMLLVSIVGTPTVAWFIKTEIHRARTLAAGSFLALVAIPLFGIPTLEISSLDIARYSLWLPAVLLGIAMSCVGGVVWALVPTVVPERLAGTALGLMILLQNLALWTAHVAAGALVDTWDRYSAMLMMFLCLGLMSVACSFALGSRARAGAAPTTVD